MIVGEKYRRRQDEGLPEAIQIVVAPFKTTRTGPGLLPAGTSQVDICFIEGPREGVLTRWSKSYIEREFVKIV